MEKLCNHITITAEAIGTTFVYLVVSNYIWRKHPSSLKDASFQFPNNQYAIRGPRMLLMYNELGKF